MSLSNSTLKQLQDLMQQNPALVAQVHNAGNASSVAMVVAKAAANEGIAVTAEELITHFSEATQANQNQPLSDAQLEAVAGGITELDARITMSVLTFGLGCAVMSIVSLAGRKTGCML